MQYPVGYFTAADGSLQLASFWDFVLNPWAVWQYAHNMSGAAITGAFIMTAVGAFYLLSGKWTDSRPHLRQDRRDRGLRVQHPADFSHGRPARQNGDRLQPVTLAAMEGLFHGQTAAPLVILGQPNEQQGKIDNPLEVPGMLSMLTYQTLERPRSRTRRFPQARLAGQYPAALLQLSHHGWPRDVLHRGDGGCVVAAMARQTVSRALDALDPDAFRAVSVHREHRRLDDRRTRPPTLAGLWTDAHRRRLLHVGLGG